MGGLGEFSLSLVLLHSLPAPPSAEGGEAADDGFVTMRESLDVSVTQEARYWGDIREIYGRYPEPEPSP